MVSPASQLNARLDLIQLLFWSLTSSVLCITNSNDWKILLQVFINSKNLVCHSTVDVNEVTLVLNVMHLVMSLSYLYLGCNLKPQLLTTFIAVNGPLAPFTRAGVLTPVSWLTSSLCCLNSPRGPNRRRYSSLSLPWEILLAENMSESWPNFPTGVNGLYL